MNKKIIASAVLALSIAGFAADTACPNGMKWDASFSGKVCTSFGDWEDYTTDQSGYWFDYNDADDGGTSTVGYGVTDTTGYYNSWYNAMASELGAITITATLGANQPADGSGTAYNPFVGIGFNLSAEGDAATVDASAWNTSGLCITYSSDAAWAMELGADVLTGYNNFKTTLKAQATAAAVSLPMSAFAQETGWGTKVTIGTALASLTAVKIKFQAKVNSTSTISITALGVDGQCTSGFNSAVAASAVKANLVGRTLSFAGIHSAANVEVINLQGQVVAKSVINNGSTMNLATLQNGVYMIRVAGKNANMNQKVVLK